METAKIALKWAFKALHTIATTVAEAYKEAREEIKNEEASNGNDSKS